MSQECVVAQDGVGCEFFKIPDGREEIKKSSADLFSQPTEGFRTTFDTPVFVPGDAAQQLNPMFVPGNAAQQLEVIEGLYGSRKPITLEQPIQPGASRRVALVIGNGSYSHVPSLTNPTRDAIAIAEHLTILGFNKVISLNDLSAETMRRALVEFGNEASNADWAMIYYAGHGIEIGGINYLVPTDARLKTDRDVQFEAIALDQVLSSVDGARKLRLVILDACRDNPFVNQMTRTVASRSVGRGLAKIEPEGATLVVYAAKGGQVALDGDGQNSPFVSSFLRHLNEPGIEIRWLFSLVRDDVLSATNSKQEPFMYGSLPAQKFIFKE